MKTSRTMCALAVVGVVLMSATSASAGWRGLADLNYDDEGRICSNGMEFSLASSLGPATVSVMVTNITAEPDVEVVPLTELPPLVFAPVPELFNVATYLHSRSFHLHFSPLPRPGSELLIQFSGGEGIDGSTVDVVDRCWLFSQFELKEALEPPVITVPENPELVTVGFHLFGVRGKGDLHGRAELLCYPLCGAGIPRIPGAHTGDRRAALQGRISIRVPLGAAGGSRRVP